MESTQRRTLSPTLGRTGGIVQDDSLFYTTGRFGLDPSTKPADLSAKERATMPIYFEPASTGQDWTAQYGETQAQAIAGAHVIWPLRSTLIDGSVVYVDVKTSAAFKDVAQNPDRPCLIFAGWLARNRISAASDDIKFPLRSGAASALVQQLQQPGFLDQVVSRLSQLAAETSNGLLNAYKLNCALQDLLPNTSKAHITFLQTLLGNPGVHECVFTLC